MGGEVFIVFIGQCGPSNVGREEFKIDVKVSPLSSIYGQVSNEVANAAPAEFPMAVLIDVLLVSEVWVLVIRGLVFIVFNCVDLVVFIESEWLLVA